ncbi:MAG: hypothetical protein K6F09_09175 [Clostridiales bacterium]|nr:hypothetical protein [Clostridiales bacterium]
MNEAGRLKRPLSMADIISAAVVCISLIGLIIRLPYCSAADCRDEIFNICQPYSLVLGVKHLVENWDFYQTGDVFSAPFLWLFVKITGNTDGIVLFSRYVFVFFLFLTFILFALIMRKTGDKRSVRCITASGLIFSTYIPMFQPVASYDTVSLMFCFLSSSCIISSLLTSDKKRHDVLMFLSGVFCALLIYSYQSALFLIPVFSLVIILTEMKLLKKDLKSSFKAFILYAAGGLAVFAIFLVFALFAGIDKLFFWNKDVNTLFLSVRPHFLSVSYLIKRIVDIAKAFVSRRATSLIVYAVLLTFYLLFRKKIKPLKYILPVLVVGYMFSLYIFIHIIKKEGNWYALSGFIFDLSLWAPVFYLGVPENRKKLCRTFLSVALPVSLSHYFIIAATEYFVEEKPENAGILLAVCSVLFIAFTFETVETERPKLKGVSSLVIASFVAVNVLSYGLFAYSGKPSYFYDYKIESGIYKGLYGKEKRDKKKEQQQKFFLSNLDENDKTLTADRIYTDFYLFSDLKPATSKLWGPSIKVTDDSYPDSVKCDWTNTLLYYEKVSGMPDVIVMSKDIINKQDIRIIEILDEQYHLHASSGDVLMYKINRAETN